MRTFLLSLVLVAGCTGLEFAGGEAADQTPSLGNSTGAGTGGNEWDAGAGGGPQGGGVGGGAFVVEEEAVQVLGPVPPEGEYLCGLIAQDRNQLVKGLPDLGSTASATWALAMLRAGRLPTQEALVASEFLAHFVPPPEVDAPSVGLHVVGEPGLPDSGYVEIAARLRVPPGREAPLRLVVVADVSPSMRDALPLLQHVLEGLPAALRDGDEVAVVTYAGDAQLAAGWTPKAELAAALDGLALDPRTGSDLDAAVQAAVSLAGDEPAHLLLVTDGLETDPEEPDGKLAAVRSRLGGNALSVALVGKPGRGDADPLTYHRSFADQLVASRGRVFYFATEADVDDMVSPVGLDRAFGVGPTSSSLTLSIAPEFTVLGEAYAAVEQEVVGGGEYPLAPGFAYPVWLSALVCNAEGLYGDGARGKLRMGLQAQVGDAELGALELEPSAWGITNLDAPTENDAEPLLDRAVFATVNALRTRDLARFDLATKALAAARTAHGCPASDAPACERLSELSEVSYRARALVAAGVPD